MKTTRGVLGAVCLCASLLSELAPSGCTVGVGCGGDTDCGPCQACRNGTCVASGDGAHCEDGTPCTTGETCQAGRCVWGGEHDCGPCLTCDAEVKACVEDFALRGTECGEGNDAAADAVCYLGGCCVRECAGRECGPDGCGGSCGGCADSWKCDEQPGQCICDRPYTPEEFDSDPVFQPERCGLPCVNRDLEAVTAYEEVAGKCRPRILLYGCKSTNWISGATYVVAFDLTNVPGDCFVIDAPDVTLDGNGRMLTSRKRPDFVVVGQIPGFAPDREDPDYDANWKVMSVIHNNTSEPSSPWTSTHVAVTGCGYMCDYSPWAAADVDGDLDLDVYMNGQWTQKRPGWPWEGNASAIFENNAGSIGPEPAFQLDPQSASHGFEAVRFLDFDQDGNVDLFAVNDGGPETLFLGGLGAADFVDVWSSANVGAFSDSADLADLDRDGRIDLLITSRLAGAGYNDYNYLLLNRLSAESQSPASLEPIAMHETYARGGGPLYSADFNADGCDDILAHADLSDDRCWWWPKSKKGPCRESYIFLGRCGDAPLESEPSLAFSDYLALGAADLDGDGDSDIVLHEYDPVAQREALLLYANVPPVDDAPVAFELVQRIELDALVAEPPHHLVGALVADLTGDGLADLTWSGFERGPLYVFRGDGAGHFASHERWPHTDDESGFILKYSAAGSPWRDMDSDGDLDVVMPAARDELDTGCETTPTGDAAPPNRAVVYLANRGDGTFEKAWSMEVCYEAEDRNDPDSVAQLRNQGFQVGAPGDLDGPVATAIRVAADGVTVRNFRTIRGFSIGVDVRGAGARLSDIEVESPEVFAVRVQGATNVSLTDVRTRFLQNATGIALVHVRDVEVTDSRLCADGKPYQDTVIGVSCREVEGLRGSANAFELNNGCIDDDFAWQTCP